MKDVGSVDMIEEFSAQLGAKVKRVELESQFRCNGSDGYLAWLDNVLDIRQTANFDLMDFDYDFRVFDDPNEMREAIKLKNAENNKSPFETAYCPHYGHSANAPFRRRSISLAVSFSAISARLS